MKIIKPSVQLLDLYEPVAAMKHLEQRIRNCYKSEARITEDSYIRLIKQMIDSKHYSTLEHISLTAKFICSRSASHQLVRHRIASYSQESQRYCNYSKGKFGAGLTFVGGDNDQELLIDIENRYLAMVRKGVPPQRARSILPNCIKTEVDVTMNPRAWRGFFELRCQPHADSEIRGLANDLLAQMAERYPPIFEDLMK